MYDSIDKRIVSCIEEGYNPVHCSVVAWEAGIIAAKTGREDYRVIDGRLQALRKRGLIRYKAGKWEVCK